MTRGAIYFDLGNTLATGLDDSVRRLLGFRLHLSEKEVKRVGRLVMTVSANDPAALATALQPALPDHSPRDILQCLRSLWREQEESVRAVPGALDLLLDLKEGGFRLGALSNTWHPFVLGLRRSCGPMAELMDDWLLSYRIGEKKPAEGLFIRAVAASALKPEQCWMVGDSYELDVAPALKAGMKAAWLLVRPEREREALAGILRGEIQAPTYVATHLDELRARFLDEAGAHP